MAVLTEGKQRDITVARALRLPRGSIVTRDRGDIAYRCRCRLTQAGVDLVTRQTVNAKFKGTARLAVDWPRGVTSEHHVVRRGPTGPADPTRLWRVGGRPPETGKHDVFWTHAFHRAATTSAAIYTKRWPLELFFKAITQPLKRKTFVGTSEKAVMTQIWVALITSLRLACWRSRAGLGLSFQQRLRLLHIHLFDRRTVVALGHPHQRQAPRGRRLWGA